MSCPCFHRSLRPGLGDRQRDCPRDQQNHQHDDAPTAPIAGRRAGALKVLATGWRVRHGTPCLPISGQPAFTRLVRSVFSPGNGNASPGITGRGGKTGVWRRQVRRVVARRLIGGAAVAPGSPRRWGPSGKQSSSQCDRYRTSLNDGVGHLNLSLEHDPGSDAERQVGLGSGQQRYDANARARRCC